MPSDQPRSFTWLDGAIMLVALIFAIPAIQWCDGQYVRRVPREEANLPPRTVERPEWFWSWQWPFDRVWHDIPAGLALLTLGAAFGVFRRPRSLSRRARRSPGVVGLAAGTIVGLIVVGEMLTEWFYAPPGSNVASYQFFNSTTRIVPGTILGAWVAVALGGQWRPRAGWPDRLGRMLGWCWLAYIAWLPIYPALWG